MKSTDKLSKNQVMAIPKHLLEKSIGEIAREYNVSWQAVWYWIGRMRAKGIKIKTRPRGKTLMNLD